MTLPIDATSAAVIGLSSVLAGAVAALATPPVLRALPEPLLAEGEVKVPYRDLPSSRLSLAAAAWSAALTLATLTSLPAAAWAPFVALALVGSVGCSIDAATTWLPKRILHVGWLVTALALAAATGTTGSGWTPLMRAAVGAALVSGLLWIAHALGGIGYSDVRLGLLTGGVTAWLSWESLYLGLLLGTTTGAGWGAVHAVGRGRGTPFPYGPSLLFGPYLAVLAQAITR